MADEESVATGDASQYQEERLQELRQEIITASAQGQPVDAPYREYVNLYLTNQNHPEQEITNSEDLTALAKEIADSIGTLVPEITTSLTRDQLEALVSAKESPSNDPAQRLVHHAAEPVMMFKGQFVHESQDIKINGAGVDFVLKRTYKNQLTYNGHLGYNWDYSYNLWMRVSNGTIFRTTGFLREDAYTQHPKFGQSGFNYWVPPDGQQGIIVENGSSYIFRTPSGDRYIYAQDSIRPLLHFIQRIEDKHGNYLAFSYQDDLIHAVEVNHPQRLIQFNYDEEERIILIQDYIGRKWQYCYDDFGDLIGVITPPTDRYREGLATGYEYSSEQFTGELQHNLTRIIDPAGQMYLENEYGSESDWLTFNRVIRQRQGGGEAIFDYEDVTQEFEYDYSDAERPAHQTTIVERNGHPVHYIYNKFGNLLLREEFIIQDGLPKLMRWRYRYNADGALSGVITPEGLVTQYYYGRDNYLRHYDVTDEDVRTDDHLTAQERMAFGNLLAVVKRGRRYDFTTMDLSRGVWGNFFPDVIAATDPSDIITKYTYEPDYQQMLTSSDPRYTQSANPAHPEKSRYQQTLTMYKYTGQPSDTHRFLSSIRYPDIRQPDGTTLTNIGQAYLLYDANGRLLRSMDPKGIITQLEYFSASDGVKEGYLKRKIVDPKTPTHNGLAIITENEVNTVGITTGIIHPRTVGALPGYFRTTFEINSIDQITRTTASLPFSYETRWFYNRNGLIERIERDLKDENGAPFQGGVEVKLYHYDEQNNLLRESIGGQDLAIHLVTRHRYNESDKRIRTILPNGNQVGRTYEERLLEASVTRGAGSAGVSTIQTKYSGDGLKIRTIDGRGNVTLYKFDTFNRLIKTIDPLGNIAHLDYDKAGNINVEQFFERQPDSTYLLLTRTEYVYDELNRRTIERKNLFQTPQLATDPETDFLASPGPGTVVETQFYYDEKGRLVKTINANGQQTTFNYDPLDRKVSAVDALGNRTLFFYDANGNLTRRDIHEKVVDPISSAFLREDVFSTLHEYDELDRMISTIDSLGNTTTLSYDSRNSQVKQIDPLGNVKRFEHDVYGRKITDIFEITDSGLGGGIALPPATTHFEYDKNGNMVSYTDAKGNRAEQQFDPLDRRISVIYPDASTQEFLYDASDNMTLKKDNNGLKHLYFFDALDRMIHMDLDSSGLAPGTAIEGAAVDFEEFDYDGLRRVRHERNRFAATGKKVDSLGRVYEESTTFTTHDDPLPGTFTIRRQFDDLGNISQITYPSGRVIRYHLDSLNRIERIENVSKGTGYPGSVNFADNYEIAHNEFRGLRKVKTIFGNGTSTTYAFDKDARIIQIAHLASDNSDLLTIQQVYDAAGNMRFKNDITPTGKKGQSYKYDSLYWMTKAEDKTTLRVFNPSGFEPSSTPAPANLLNGQEQIDALIGPLAQSPADFTYRYDLMGNREEEKQPGLPSNSYTINGLNQYLAAGTGILNYDLNGNLIHDGRWQYFYDYQNQLVRVYDPARSQNLVQSIYDVQGRRILSLIGGLATHFIIDDQNSIEEYRGTRLWAQLVKEYDLDTLCQITVQGNEYWYHKELTRSTRILTDSSGLVAGQYDYETFGRFTKKIGPYNPYCYMSSMLDIDEPDFSIYCYRLRHYSTFLGRFLQRDVKSTEEKYNLYVAFGNNPLIFVDPLGREKSPLNPNPSVQEVEDIDPGVQEAMRLFREFRQSNLETIKVGELENIVLGIADTKGIEPQALSSQPAKPSSQSGGSEALAYPLGERGRVGEGSVGHSKRPLGNWESDNAVDIVVPQGTPVYAVADGKIGGPKQFGALSSNDPKLQGLRLHLRTQDNEFYYAHLSQFAPGIAPGISVKKGDLLGYSGKAAGVPHLHLGIKNGDPVDLLNLERR